MNEKTEEKRYKLHEIDSGFCRIYYKVSGIKTGQVFYRCIQQEFENVFIVYATSNDCFKEPSHEIKFKDGIKLKDLFELPEGNTALEIGIKNFILNN